MICVGTVLLTPTRIWPPCSEVISGTATGRMAGTAVPFTSGHAGLVVLVLLVPAGQQTALVPHTASDRKHGQLLEGFLEGLTRYVLTSQKVGAG